VEEVLVSKGLTKRFGGIVALRSVDFKVYRGEVVGVIGPNGAGKTTLVNCITGVYKPDEGRVHFEGLDITGLPPHSIAVLGIARTWQKIRPFYEMTPLEAVTVGALLRTKDISQARRIALETLELVGFPQRKYHTPGRNLTLMEHKLVDLARALATKPRLLFIDEIIAGLRPQEIPTIVRLIKKVNQEEGVTMVIIEHVVRFIAEVSQRVVAIHEGRIIAEGSVEEVLNNPVVVEAYLGSKPG